MPLHYLSRITHTYRSHSNLRRVIQVTQALISEKKKKRYHGMIEKFTRILIQHTLAHPLHSLNVNSARGKVNPLRVSY